MLSINSCIDPVPFCISYSLSFMISLHSVAYGLGTRRYQERPKTFTGATSLGFILVRYWSTSTFIVTKFFIPGSFTDDLQTMSRHCADIVWLGSGTFAGRICLNYFILVATQALSETHLEGTQFLGTMCFHLSPNPTDFTRIRSIQICITARL